MMENFAVTFYFETSDKPQTDLTLFAKVSAENAASALTLAKAILEVENPNVNFHKIWLWHIEGRPDTCRVF